MDSRFKLEIFRADTESSVALPYIDYGIRAGFPSPAQDYIDGSIDLNKVLVGNPAVTFYGKVSGDSLVDAHINDGDIIVVDKSLEPKHGDLAVCCVDGEFTLKFIEMQKGEIWLVPANKKYGPIRITEENDFIVWGIVTFSIKRHRKGAVRKNVRPR